ncbi:hypothetical protein CC86DRAFT_38198 [Ophiobolus disseminans]|uniref:Uncharacterized protein n=1 Tax=Ophiobolus disseminans TaxID=1469910 RepID=A0A6A6ZZU1_9PLEO|nr:hypothetical protein CC86DRAFT_38198 [Ophiobolus disseminans]
MRQALPRAQLHSIVIVSFERCLELKAGSADVEIFGPCRASGTWCSSKLPACTATVCGTSNWNIAHTKGDFSMLSTSILLDSPLLSSSFNHMFSPVSVDGRKTPRCCASHYEVTRPFILSRLCRILKSVHVNKHEAAPQCIGNTTALAYLLDSCGENELMRAVKAGGTRCSIIAPLHSRPFESAGSNS